MLIPTDEIDIYWHEHILDTKKYMKDCDNIFNEYFHHCPYIGSNQSDINSEKAKDLFNETQTLFYKEFGYYMCEIRVSLFGYLKHFISKIFQK